MELTQELNIFYVGENPQQATAGLPFDSYESAESYQADWPQCNIYIATAIVDFTTLEEYHD